MYTKLRKQKNKATGKPLSDAMEGGYIDHNPAWRTYKYAGQKKEKKIADDETVKKLIQALEAESVLHETYFKLIIATGMWRGECCALKWEDTANRRPRWISTPTPLTKIKKQPVRSCRATWRSELSSEKLCPVALRSKNR